MDTFLSEISRFLEYGLPGLAAVVLVLGYLLLRAESKKQDPSAAILRSTNIFMAFAVLLLVASGLLGTTTNATSADADTACRRAMAYTATSVANSIESQMLQIDGKIRALPDYPGLDEKEVAYRLLRRGVFRDMMLFSADRTLLQETLDELVRRNRITEGMAGRLLAELPQLKTLRLQWLTETAIPMVERATAQLRDSPIQAIPGADVPLPKEVNILPDEGATEHLENVERLREEQRLLREEA